MVSAMAGRGSGCNYDTATVLISGLAMLVCLCVLVGNFYTVGVCIPADYPASQPELILLSPNPCTLRDGHTKLISKGASHAFHILGAHSSGVPKLCHGKEQMWTQNDTIYKILTKAHLWVNAYDCYLVNGQDPAVYLKAM
jgi:hypothetical protein